MAKITLILGGARSGKSALACQLAAQSGLAVTYIATATARDAEMATRIQHHQQERPADWLLVEAPVALAQAIAAHAGDGRCLLVDCLTLWLTNLLHDADGQPQPDTLLSEHFLALEQALEQAAGTIVLVSNEVGLGIIPLGELTRRFVDEAGRLNQRLARLADHVFFVAAGLPLPLKG